MKGIFGENLPSIPTNRSKYDDKPMPPLPDPSPSRPPRKRSNDRFYIHPATPYRKTPINLNHVKDRAATDPIIPKPLFASKDKIRTQPSGEIAEPNYDQEGYDDGESFQKQPSAPPSTAVPSKASAVLGFYPVSSNKVLDEMPSSAPPSMTPPDLHRSSEEPSSVSPSPPRQVQSTPVPTRSYVRGNAILTPTLTQSSRASSRQMGDTESDGGPVRGIITGGGLLSPTRAGGYGKLGGATFVDQIDMQRVDSQMGIIETVGSPAPTEKSSCSHHHNDDYDINLPQTSHETLRYTQGNYAGVWENDPHVVRIHMREVLEDLLMKTRAILCRHSVPIRLNTKLSLCHQIQTCMHPMNHLLHIQQGRARIRSISLHLIQIMRRTATDILDTHQRSPLHPMRFVWASTMPTLQRNPTILGGCLITREETHIHHQIYSHQATLSRERAYLGLFIPVGKTLIQQDLRITNLDCSHRQCKLGWCIWRWLCIITLRIVLRV